MGVGWWFQGSPRSTSILDCTKYGKCRQLNLGIISMLACQQDMFLSVIDVMCADVSTRVSTRITRMCQSVSVQILGGHVLDSIKTCQHVSAIERVKVCHVANSIERVARRCQNVSARVSNRTCQNVSTRVNARTCQNVSTRVNARTCQSVSLQFSGVISWNVSKRVYTRTCQHVSWHF